MTCEKWRQLLDRRQASEKTGMCMDPLCTCRLKSGRNKRTKTVLNSNEINF